MCCGGGPDIKNDPNVGRAALRQADIADRMQRFTERYYTETMSPLLEQMKSASEQAQAQQEQLFNLQFPQAEAQAEQYTRYGLPAQEAYYQMVQQYSEPEEYERQAQAAMADVINARQVQQANTGRMLAARGIDPTSGAAMNMQYNNDILSAASGAAAANRARDAARNMGMQLKAGAADFASGRPASNIAMFSQGAGNASNSAFDVAGNAIGAANQGAAIPLQGYTGAGNMYGQQMQTYGNLAAAQAQANAQESAGFGNFLGSALGTGLAAYAVFGGTAAASDRRLKRNISRVGSLPNGLSVYEFEYIWGGGKKIGVMADEVEQILPSAVMTDSLGFKAVDYSQLR